VITALCSLVRLLLSTNSNLLLLLHTDDNQPHASSVTVVHSYKLLLYISDSPNTYLFANQTITRLSVPWTRSERSVWRLRTSGTHYSEWHPQRQFAVNVPCQTENTLFYCCVLVMNIATSAPLYWLLADIIGAIQIFLHVHLHDTVCSLTATMQRTISLYRQTALHPANPHPVAINQSKDF